MRSLLKERCVVIGTESSPTSLPLTYRANQLSPQMSAINFVGAPDALVEVGIAVLRVGFEVLFEDFEDAQAASASITKHTAKTTARGRVNEAMVVTVPNWASSRALRVQHLRQFLETT